MKKTGLFLLILSTSLCIGSFNSCKDKDDDDDGNNHNPPPPGTMTCTVDGIAWTASLGASGANISGIVSVTGTSSDQTQCNISMYDLPGPGTYPIGGSTPNSNGARFTRGTGAENIYQVSFGIGEGTVTVNVFSSTRISGTFSFTALNSLGEEVMVTGGAFDVGFAQ